MNRALIWLTVSIFALLTSSISRAQQSEIFGPYELHYSVVNTTFLDPKVAGLYGITRGENDGSDARTMQLKGRTWDLIQSQSLEFKEIREGPAIYYIAEFKFINEEWRFFEMDFRPEGSSETLHFKFKHQLYIN
jgi:hypothetical protein